MFGGNGDDYSFWGPPRPLRGVCRQQTHALNGFGIYVASHRAVSASSNALHAHPTTGEEGNDTLYGGSGADSDFAGEIVNY